jgi:hypothetical protein
MLPYPQLHNLEQGRRKQDQGVGGESYKLLWGDRSLEIQVGVQRTLVTDKLHRLAH